MTIGWSRVNEHIIEFYLYCIRYTINILYYLTDLQQVSLKSKSLKSDLLKIGNFEKFRRFLKGSPESGLQTQAILFFKLMSERGGSDIDRF